MMIPVWILIPYCIVLTVYLVFEQKKRFVAATALKLTLSAMFCATAWTALGQTNAVPALMISLGLSLALVGDFFLQYIKRDNKKFKTGILLFAGTQVCLLMAYYLLCPPSWPEFVFLAAFLVLALVLMRVQHWDVSAQNPHITLYTLLIAWMGAKALSFVFAAPQYMLLAWGGVLFFVSDMILGIWNYKYSKKMLFAHLNWLTYFAGEILIAFGVWML